MREREREGKREEIKKRYKGDRVTKEGTWKRGRKT